MCIRDRVCSVPQRAGARYGAQGHRAQGPYLPTLSPYLPTLSPYAIPLSPDAISLSPDAVSLHTTTLSPYAPLYCLPTPHYTVSLRSLRNLPTLGAVSPYAPLDRLPTASPHASLRVHTVSLRPTAPSS
eukprot:2686970-Rhodomonas_salina.1